MCVVRNSRANTLCSVRASDKAGGGGGETDHQCSVPQYLDLIFLGEDEIASVLAGCEDFLPRSGPCLGLSSDNLPQ